MDSEVLEIVLKEILEEQKQTNIIDTKLVEHLNVLATRIESSKSDLRLLQAIENKIVNNELLLKESIKKIDAVMNAKHQPVVNKKIFQFFPDSNIREYYMVYGNLLKWLAMFATACLILKLARDFLEKIGYL